MGSTGHNAYYTPSGSTTPGNWVAAPDFPNSHGTPDAPAAMMFNGKVLCNASPIPTFANHFPTPTTFYEFGPNTNLFTTITAPGGGTNVNVSSYVTTFLSLPDGNILYAQQGTNRYYVYTPTGSPQNLWRPTISNVTQIGTNIYQCSGTQFNGISEGSTYGDDWQMNSNYPIVRLVSGTNVYYARTSNWNSTGVRRGNVGDIVTFTLPTGLPHVTYSLYAIANGIASLPFQFSLVCASNITITGSYASPITQSSNWIKSSGQTTILNTANVKLDADPLAGYVELKPTIATDYFLAAPSTTSGVFIAQALDGCGGSVPARIGVLDTPIITTKLLNVSPIPPLHKFAITNVDSIAKNNTIDIFPNPAKESFIVKSNNDIQNAKLQLIDVEGKLQSITIENIDRHTKKVKWNYLSTGIYLLKIIWNSKTDFAKVVINN